MAFVVRKFRFRAPTLFMAFALTALACADFTDPRPPGLTDISAHTGVLEPGFDESHYQYSLTVPAADVDLFDRGVLIQLRTLGEQLHPLVYAHDDLVAQRGADASYWVPVYHGEQRQGTDMVIRVPEARLEAQEYRLRIDRGLAQVVAEGAREEAELGRSLAATHNRIALAAPNGLQPGGDLFVLEYDATGHGWEQVDILSEDDEGFGAHVAMAGAWLATSVASGEVWTYQLGPDGTYGSRRRVQSDEPRFGTGIGLVDDFLVIGSPAEDSGQLGRVHIYEDRDGEWREVMSLPAADEPPSGAFYGSSLAVCDDWLMVASPVEEGGAVIAYQRMGQVWKRRGAVSEVTDRGYGDALACHGGRLAVGAANADVSLKSEVISGAGVVFVYVYSEDSLTELTTISSPSILREGRFGRSVAINGQWLAVGASNEPRVEAGKRVGAAYLYRWGEDLDTQALRLTLDNADVEVADYGRWVAFAGGDLIVSAPAMTSAAQKESFAGVVFRY